MFVTQQKFRITLISSALVFSTPLLAAIKNGFNLDGSLIPTAEILHGGPSRDGIPAINQPKFITAKRASFLKSSNRVLALHRNGISKAYPIAIMNWHEIVNDKLGEEAIVVTFCPLCGTGIAFSSITNNQHHIFGVSGLLYNSDVLLYDRETESLWSQLLTKAVTGPQKGSKLKLIPLEHTTWGDWRQRHPETLVLSTNTGFSRDYDRDPYSGYIDSRGIYFPVSHKDPRYHPKERVIGLEINGQFKAYPFAELSKTSGEITDTLADKNIRIHYDAANQSARASDANGNKLAGIIGFWFAWIAFHPDTEVFQVR